MSGISDLLSRVEIDCEHKVWRRLNSNELFQAPLLPSMEERTSKTLDTKSGSVCSTLDKDCYNTSTLFEKQVISKYDTRKWLIGADPIPEFGPKKFEKLICGFRSRLSDVTLDDPLNLKRDSGTKCRFLQEPTFPSEPSHCDQGEESIFVNRINSIPRDTLVLYRPGLNSRMDVSLDIKEDPEAEYCLVQEPIPHNTAVLPPEEILICGERDRSVLSVVTLNDFSDLKRDYGTGCRFLQEPTLPSKPLHLDAGEESTFANPIDSISNDALVFYRPELLNSRMDISSDIKEDLETEYRFVQESIPQNAAMFPPEERLEPNSDVIKSTNKGGKSPKCKNVERYAANKRSKRVSVGGRQSENTSQRRIRSERAVDKRPLPPLIFARPVRNKRNLSNS